VRLSSGVPPEPHDIRITYDITYLSATPSSQPVPLLGPVLRWLLVTGLVVMGVVTALRMRGVQAPGFRQ